MTINEYLLSVLRSQELETESNELQSLRVHRAEVESILRNAFSDASPTIRYGGSYTKGTLIRESYDLDIVCYFPSDEDGAGRTLKSIYDNVLQALAGKYAVEPKTSAIRLVSNEPNSKGKYFHIDVVPGRYTDESQTDCYLYQNGGEKERLKTNLDVHLEHIRDSGVVPAIRLLKLWRVRNGVNTKQFVFELLCVDLLDGKEAASLEDQVKYVLQTVANASSPIAVQDPANPSGNNLMPILTETWAGLRMVAAYTLSTIENSGWGAVYGTTAVEPDSVRAERVVAAMKSVEQPTQPWSAYSLYLMTKAK